jgi:lipopolysaccharide cholinephosphotransferase
MTAKDFLQEVLQSDQCPENFEVIYERFQKFQKEALDTLRAFHRVCEDNAIPYQLTYGSLLGAVRDNGQIPWDYDVDVFVPYNKKDQLVEALKKDLPERFYFYCPEVDPKCRHYIMRLAPKGFRTEVLHVDVFYVIGAPEDPQAQKDFGLQVLKAFQNRYGKLVRPWDEACGDLRRFAGLVRDKLKTVGLSLKSVDRNFRALAEQYPMDSAKYCLGVDTDCVKRCYVSQMLWDTELMETAEGTFRVPKEREKLLEMMYGDYRKAFPLQRRLGECMRNYRRLMNKCKGEGL